MQESLTIHPPPLRTLKLPQIWYKNNPVKTHFFNALSTLFPQGENFFIGSIRNLAHRAQSETLRLQIQDFITQEKNHAAIHKAYNRCLAKAGYDIAWMEVMLQQKINFAQEKVPRIMCLAITAATEHITAILGEKVLTGKFLPEGLVDADVRRVWIWHSLEEVDHKSVAIDLFIDAGGTYVQRCRAMLYTMFGFWSDTFIRLFHLLKKDGLLWKPRTWLQIGDLLLGKNGVLWLMTWDTLKFFSPRFHPDRHDNYGLVDQGRRMLQAAAAG